MAAAETSAAIVATSWAAPKLVGEILLTSNVLFIGPWEVPQYGVDEWAGIWVGTVVSDSGVMPGPAASDSRSGWLSLSSRIGRASERNMAGLGESYTVVPLLVFTVPGT